MSPKRGFATEDQWLLASISDPQLSPDGTSVAFVVGTPDKETDKPATVIWVGPTDRSGAARPFTSGPQDSAPRWSPDGKWLAFAAERGEGPQLYLAPLDGGEARAITEMTNGVAQPAWSPDGRHLVFVSKTGEWTKPEDRSALEKAAPRVITGSYAHYDGIGWFDQRRSHLFVIPVEGGAPRQITSGDWDDADPTWAPAGDRLAFVSDRSATRGDEVHRDVFVVPISGARRPRRLTRGIGTAAAPRFSPDGQMIAYVGHENGEGDSAANTHLLVVEVAQANAPRSLSAALDRTVFGLMGAPGTTHMWSPGGDSVLFLAADRGGLALYRSALAKTEPALVVGGDRQITTFHQANGVTSFVAQWPSSPPELYCLAHGEAKEQRVSNANAAVRALRLSPVRRKSHVTPDGERIESFVLYPPDYVKDTPAPTVLEIHGGPHGFHPQAPLFGLYQSLAAAGYVVVLANPRGSHGYGEHFARACVGDWGGKDFEDLMGTVDELLQSGVADPKRLYVTGYSYGGYMTSWVVGHTDRFAAACVAAPVTDLVSMWGTTDIPNFAEFELGALPTEAAETYAKHSPLTYVAKVTTPVQLFHWEGDLRCPIGQSEEFFQGLHRLGREVVMVRYPAGFHTVRSPSQMVDYVARHLDWFAQH